MPTMCISYTIAGNNFCSNNATCWMSLAAPEKRLKLDGVFEQLLVNRLSPLICVSM
jgi:hypothetical protein